MLARDLIEELKRRIELHKPHEAVMGELEIYIDQFEIGQGGAIAYAGASRDIRITLSADGVMEILTAWTPDTK